MRNLLIIFVVLAFSGCTTVRYENSIVINGTKDLAFMILEDYENYPNIIPEVHDNVRIISENRTGLGVQFINNSTFGGFNTESLFEVVEYRFNEYIKLKNLTHYGFTELKLADIEYGKFQFTLINYTKIPFFMRKKLFNVFDKELEIIKEIVENGNNWK